MMASRADIHLVADGQDSGLHAANSHLLLTIEFDHILKVILILSQSSFGCLYLYCHSIMEICPAAEKYQSRPGVGRAGRHY